jgi:hypothetical protein
LALLALLAGSADAADEPAGRIERIDVKTDDPSVTKVILMLSQPLPFHVRVFNGEGDKKSTKRLVLDFDDTTLGPEAAAPIDVGNALVQKVRPGQFTARAARIVLDIASDAKYSVDAYETPPHVTVAIGDTSKKDEPAPAPSRIPLDLHLREVDRPPTLRPQ